MWCALAPTSDQAHNIGGGEDHDRSRVATTPHDGPLLEFLYPEKTLAFIRRLSTFGSDKADCRRRAVLGAGTRQFSTSQWQSTSDDGADNLEAVQAKQEMDGLLLYSTADDALRKFLGSKEKGKQELVWRLYSAMIEPVPPMDLLCDTLDYLSNSDHPRTADRALQIFNCIAVPDRRASSYRIAVNAYVELRMLGPAIQLLEEASERFNPTHTGIDAVLKRTIQDDQWDLSFRVFRMFLRYADRNELRVDAWKGDGKTHDRYWRPLFGRARHVLEPIEHLQSFLDHVGQFRHELNSSDSDKRMLHLFVQGYVPGVMAEVLNTPEPDEDFIYDFFSNIFRDLRAQAIPVEALYEFAIPAFVQMPRYQAYTNRPKVYLDLYESWRQNSLDGHCNPPSQRVIDLLIVQYSRHESYLRVNDLVEDFRVFHPHATFPRHLVKHLIRFYAKGGLVERVHEFFQILQEHFASAVDLHILVSLPYAYARRVDVPGAIQQFKRITDEFNLVPDTACWTALLTAFTRADDFEGALECFNRCLESGVIPNQITFGHMLDLCADRGDVEAFEALFTKAKQLGVPLETDPRARSGYVRAFLNHGDPEGAEQIALGILQNWQAGTFGNEPITHVWNLLIAHYAVAGRLADSRRMYNQMTANQIPLNTWTYAALMRSMVEAKQTSAAYKILRVTMPSRNVRPYAFHHALVISGFLRERQYHKARQAYNRMRNMGIRPTASLRKQELFLKGTQDLSKLREEKNEDPRARLVQVEESLRESLLSNYGHEIAADEPTLNRYIDSPEVNNIPQGYLAIAIMLYNTRGAYDIAKELFESAAKMQTHEQSYSTAIALITALMQVHARQGEYEEVERCWDLARTEATRLIKTFGQVMQPEPPKPIFDTIVDPAIKTQFEASRVAKNRRQILFHAARTYVRALLAQDTPESLQRVQRTFYDLLTHGFVVDNLTWNEFIQHLAARHRVIDAFTACEMYLMPNFPGWADLSPTYIRHWLPGYSFMELRHYELKRSSVLPRYKTLVLLAAAHRKVKQDESNGVGWVGNQEGWLREVLDRIAPSTVRAIESMPRTGDSLQRQYLSDM